MKGFKPVFFILLLVLLYGIPKFASATEPTPAELIVAMQKQMPEADASCVAEAVPLIARSLAKRGILTKEILAYAYATAEQETQKSFCANKEEEKGIANAIRLGYGVDYIGRGLIQLTGKRNYRLMSEWLGIDILSNPKRALEPEIAAEVLAEYFVRFKTAEIISNANDNEYLVNARISVNGGTEPASIATRYKEFLLVLPTTNELKTMFGVPERITQYGG